MVDDDAESSSCEIGARLICQQDRQKKTSYPHDTEQPPPLTLTLVYIFMTYDKQIGLIEFALIGNRILVATEEQK